MQEERYSIQVLLEAVEVQRKKSQDYQNPNSTVKQADYYVHGIDTIMDTVHGKMLRVKSLLEAVKEEPEAKANHESIADSMIDSINYLSFAVAWMEGKIPGQDPTTGIFSNK